MERAILFTLLNGCREGEKGMLNAAKIADNWRKVVEIKNSSKGHRPDLDAKSIVDTLGLEPTLETFSCIVRIKKNDGRIYGKVREYFSKIEVDESAAVYEIENPVIRAGLDDIHPTHIQQIAWYIMQIAEEQ